jgi:hypothetical protein
MAWGAPGNLHTSSKYLSSKWEIGPGNFPEKLTLILAAGDEFGGKFN